MQKAKKNRIAILGFGKEGRSLMNFLKRHPSYRNSRISIRDQKQGKQYLRGLSKFDIVFRSPGVPYLLKEIQAAKKHGVKISSATKLFFDLLKAELPVIIGVTGTKGKGTTCTLLTHILKTAGKKVVLAGNIGKPMLDVLPVAKRADYVVLELSSFQLQDITESPDIAVMLDVFPDHLDAHKNLKEYFDAKSNITRYQSPKGRAFYFVDNPLSKRVAKRGKGKKIAVRPSENSLRKNFEMATSVARSLKIPQKTIKRALSTFKGLEHRLEFVRRLRVPQRHPYKLENVRMSFINDSAATNPEAAAAAVRTFRAPLILIAGGKDKGLDYSPLANAVLASKNLQMVILFGENKKKIRDSIMDQFRNSKKTIATPHIVLVENLREAILLAHKFAKATTTNGYWPNAVILFSPAAASFDQFKNYAGRGEMFKRLVQGLK